MIFGLHLINKILKIQFLAVISFINGAKCEGGFSILMFLDAHAISRMWYSAYVMLVSHSQGLLIARVGARRTNDRQEGYQELAGACITNNGPDNLRHF